jgi:hypothetical protein
MQLHVRPRHVDEQEHAGQDESDDRDERYNLATPSLPLRPPAQFDEPSQSRRRLEPGLSNFTVGPNRLGSDFLDTARQQLA